MKKIKNISLILVLLPLLLNIGQQRYKSERNADIIRYTVKDGLPISNIAAVSQTDDGYVWISGLEGTVRFNGYEFQEPGKEYGLPDMHFNYYDSTNNTIYFASPDKFLILKNNEFELFTEGEGYKTSGLPGRIVSFINKDSKNRIWIGTTTLYNDSEFNGSLTLFENGKFTLFDSSMFPLHNSTYMFETPYGDLIFLSDGRNTINQTEAHIALYKDGKFHKIDQSQGVNYLGTKFLYEKVLPVTDNKGNTWIPFVGSGTWYELNDGTSGVVMYDGKDFHTYPGIQKYLTANNRVTSVMYLEKDKNIYATISDLNGSIYSKTSNILFRFVNDHWEKVDIFKDTGFVTNLSTKENIPSYKYTLAKLIPGNKIFPDLLAIGILEETIAKEYNEQYFYFDGTWKKYDGFSGFPLTEINGASVIFNPLGFSLYFPNNSVLLDEKDGISGIKADFPYMYSDLNGLVWIYYSYTDSPPEIIINPVGINVWDGTKLHKITTKQGLSSNVVYSVFEDSKGRIWLPNDKGLDIAKAIITRENNWVIKVDNIKTESGETINLSKVMETQSGDLFTWQNYVRPTDNKTSEAKYFMGKVVGDQIIEISNPLPDSLKKFKYQIHELHDMPNERLMLVSYFSDSENNIKTANSSLMIYDYNKWYTPPISWNVPKNNLNYVGTLNEIMYFLSPGYFFSFNGNVFADLSDSVNEHADFRILKEANSAGTLTNIQADQYLYIRLRLKGLTIFDGKELNFYTTKNGLPTANIWNPITDRKGNAYFIHNLGGLIINGEQINTYYNDNFIISGPSAISRDVNNNILTWYSNRGLYIDRQTTFESAIKLSSIKVNNNQYYYNIPASFGYEENSIIFNYSELNLREINSTVYQHKLEGYDLDWSKPSNLQFSEYQNLAPGDYKFNVRSIKNDGSKTNQVSYSFSISPPFWKTWWAYTFYLLMLMGFLYSIRKFELKRQRKNSAIKESQLRAETAEFQAKAAEAQSRVIQAESERKSAELEEARQLQLSMLPKELPKIDNLEIAVYMKTATEVGGDYYDFSISVDGTLNVGVGDATGHGMQAGTIVTLLKGLFTSEVSKKELLTFLRETSNAIKGIELGRLMMAFSLLKIKSNKIQFSSGRNAANVHF